MVIKDTLSRLQLSLSTCRGQCYDGASNMLGKESGIAKKFKSVNQKLTDASHCHSHALSLSIKDATKYSKILSDIMNNTKKIVKLMDWFFPKRERLLGDVKSNLIEEDDAAGLTKFSATRWTVRTVCFQRVLDNYDALKTTTATTTLYWYNNMIRSVNTRMWMKEKRSE